MELIFSSHIAFLIEMVSFDIILFATVRDLEIIATSLISIQFRVKGYGLENVLFF